MEVNQLTAPPSADRSSRRSSWLLDPTITFLNHGSFGACPVPVLEHQQRLREELEREPVWFLDRRLRPLLDEVREELAGFVGARPADLAFVANATTGVNAVLRSFPFGLGDEVLTTDHEYGACTKALRSIAARRGVRVITAALPFPVEGPAAILDAVLAAATPRTRLALLSHVTSPTALVLPVEELVRRLQARGIETLVDGAHGPGMVPLHLDELGAAYYAGNCHKWLCAPKGAGFLHVRPDRQAELHPLVVSHGVLIPERSVFHEEFDWTGTFDPTAWLCIGEAIRWLGIQLPGGWPALLAHNHQRAVAARRRLCTDLGLAPPCPEELLGAMAALPLVWPGRRAPLAGMQQALFERWQIEVPIIAWPDPQHQLVRISAQLYNTAGQYERLSKALCDLLTG